MPVTYIGPDTLTKELFNDRLVSNPPSIVGFDIETISLKERMPIGFSISTSDTESFYFDTYPEQDPEVELVQPLLNNPAIKKIIHNALFDLRSFPLICPIDRSNIADTNVMARLLGYQETALEWLAGEVDRESESAKSMLGPGQTMLDLPKVLVAKKCCNDSQIALKLYYHYLPRIDPEYFRVEMESVPIVIDMSLRGMKVHQQDRADLQEKLEIEGELLRRICEEEGFNPGSNQQVGYILAKRRNFLRLTKSRKHLKVSSEELEFLDDPLAQVVLRYRHIVNKSLGTYIGPLEGHDRAYTNYNFDARVGRISSSKSEMPGYLNMQNIPPELRFIFVPDSGVFTIGDYSQEHLYILMHFSGDRQMQKVYLETEPGVKPDLHAHTAKLMRIDRRVARNVNYSAVYGGTARTVQQYTKIRDLRKCQAFLDGWAREYPQAFDWIRHAQREGLQDGWALPTLFGRRIRIPEEYEEGMRNKAVNYPILGSDGEIMKRALIVCAGYGLPLAATVHDNITLDGDCEFPVDELENIAPIRIPFATKQTLRWE